MFRREKSESDAVPASHEAGQEAALPLAEIQALVIRLSNHMLDLTTALDELTTRVARLDEHLEGSTRTGPQTGHELPAPSDEPAADDAESVIVTKARARRAALLKAELEEGRGTKRAEHAQGERSKDKMHISRRGDRGSSAERQD